MRPKKDAAPPKKLGVNVPAALWEELRRLYPDLSDTDLVGTAVKAAVERRKAEQAGDVRPDPAHRAKTIAVMREFPEIAKLLDAPSAKTTPARKPPKRR